MLKTKLLTVEECKEIIACKDDFSYFCYTIGWELTPQQEEVYQQISKNDYLIFSKYRNGGFTTIMLLYSLWKAAFYAKQSIVYYGPHQKMIDEFSHIMNALLKNSKIDFGKIYGTSRLAPSPAKSYIFNDLENTVNLSKFTGIKANATTMIFDEAAFIDADFESLTSMGFEKIIVFSSVDDIYDSFWRTLERARNKENDFAVYTTDVNDHVEDLSEYKDLPNFKRDFLQMPPSMEQKYRSIYDD